MSVLAPQDYTNRIFVRRPTEFAWIAVLLGGLLFLAINLFWLFPTVRDLESIAKEKQRETALRAASATNDFIANEHEALSMSTKAIQPLQSILPVEVKSFLSEYVKARESVFELTLIGADGREEYRVSKLFDLSPSDFSDRSQDPEFLETKEMGTYMSQLHAAEDPYVFPLLKIASPIKRGDEFFGVLSAKIKLQGMWDLVESFKVGERGFTYVVDKQGVVIAHPDQSITLENRNVSNRSIITRALQSQTAVTGEYVNENGDTVFATASILPHIGWVAVVEEPKADMFRARDRLNMISMWGIVLGFGVLLILTWNWYSLARTTRLLDRQRNHTAAIIRYLTDGILQYDHGTKIMLMNPMAEQLLGVSWREVVGRVIEPRDLRNPKLKVLAQVLYPSLAAQVRRVTNDPNEYPKIHEIRITDPVERDFQVATVPILDERGISTGFLKVIHDISRERLIARAKSEFISIAAHQLRTPLSGIKWTLKLLLDQDLGPITEKQKTFLTKGYETNERMIALIRDLLDVARLEEGRFGFEFKEEDMAKLLLSVIREHEPHAEQKGISLKYDLPKQPLPSMTVDASKLALAITNLVDNAIKYTSKGSVTLSAVVKKPFLEMRVKDTGIGIPKDQKLQLFSKFFRARNALKIQTDGSGLGLFIVRNIIRRHGGEIWFESIEGKGTTFVFTIPMRKDLIPKSDSIVGD